MTTYYKSLLTSLFLREEYKASPFESLRVRGLLSLLPRLKEIAAVTQLLLNDYKPPFIRD
jgi:hypothetical protein